MIVKVNNDDNDDDDDDDDDEIYISEHGMTLGHILAQCV